MTIRTYGQAQGEPWQIMYVNIMNMLLRSTALFPLRLTCKEVIEPCLPEWPEAGWKLDNVYACLNLSAHVQFIHTDNAFWMERDEGTNDFWPTPVSSDAGVIIGRDHPHFEAIGKWITTAEEHDDFLGESRMYLNRLLKVLKHPQWVEHYWPDIVPYIGKVPKAMTKGLREPIPRQVLQDAVLQDRIQNMLTASALLPRGYETRSWVGVYAARRVE